MAVTLGGGGGSPPSSPPSPKVTGRVGYRIAVSAFAAVLAVFAGVPAVTSAALFEWSAPIPLASTGRPLVAVACPSTSQCTAVDSNGAELTFNPSSPTTSTPATIDPGRALLWIACPSDSQCTAVDATHEVTFDPRSPDNATPIAIPNPLGVAGLACPSTTQCTAVDNAGGEISFNPTAPGTPARTPIDANGLYLRGVACPSTSQCTTPDFYGAEVTFNPLDPGTPASATIDPGDTLPTGVACPSSTRCVVIDRLGTVVTFDPGAPNVRTFATIDSGNSLQAVSCPSASECVAVDSVGRAFVGDPWNPGTWIADSISGASSLVAVACASVWQCVVVDTLGNTFVGIITRPVNTSLPTISGPAVEGQTLNATHGSWSPGADGYVYQWQRCDSTGNGCASITGATGQSYTLSTADVGSTIRVLETASNAAGAGDPATSAQTSVVTGVPVNVSPPSVSGQAVQGQVLTEAHGSWSNGPTGYADQWQRCDGEGNACAAIAGATGPSYALTGSDVGSTVRVRETASNSVGPGLAASSEQTAVVAAATTPKVTGFRLTNDVFAITAAATPTSANAAGAGGHKRGTLFKYTLSEAATVRIMISRRLAGRCHGRSCVAPTKTNRHAPACTRALGRGTLVRVSRRGANSVAFSGRIGSRPLQPGSYQATLTATGPAKRTSKPKTISFTILAR